MFENLKFTSTHVYTYFTVDAFLQKLISRSKYNMDLKLEPVTQYTFVNKGYLLHQFLFDNLSTVYLTDQTVFIIYQEQQVALEY